MGQTADGNIYDGAIKDNHTLCKIVAKTDDNRVITLKETLWNNALKNRLLNLNSSIDFNFIPQSFIPGPYLKICVSCESSFLANKRQHVCINCCEEHGRVAFKAGKGPVQKTKRSRMLSAKTALRIAKSAFEAGRNSGVSFDEWSNTYNQHALHSDRNHTPGDE